ncbi:MAG: EpsI family protein [Acidimicrobiia bacterium]|nr:EpsI family protein [Acidimicrobiia bacterium]
MPESPLSFLKRRPMQLLTALLLLQAAVYYGKARSPEDVPQVKPLAEFPAQLESWAMVRESAVEKEIQDVLRADDLLSRTYGNGTDPEGANLFVAYFHSQQTGKAPHSPKNCLPGSGWVASSASVINVQIPGESAIEVNRYLVTKGDYTSLVLYWYQSRNRVVASEYWAKIYLVLDSIRYNRSDTALVRVVVPVRDKNDTGAEALAVNFIQNIFPQLKHYFPA